MASWYDSFTERNIGTVSREEQDLIAKARTAIAGVGGIGGLLAERLVRLGVNYISLCDPDTFDTGNLNRQFGATGKTIGHNKARTVGALLREINPDISIHCDTNGITDQESADRFADTCDIIVDEMDFGLFRQSGFLQNSAKKQSKPYIFSSAVGFGAYVCAFRPKELTLNEYNKVKTDTISDGSLPDVGIETILPYVPEYMKSKMDIVQEMLSGKRAVSTNSIGVGLASVMTAHTVLRMILEPDSIPYDKPFLYVIDLQDGCLRQSFGP